MFIQIGMVFGSLVQVMGYLGTFGIFCYLGLHLSLTNCKKENEDDDDFNFSSV